eukprot:1158244-Pelagomonas_calceolata.AAC.10
MRGKNRVVRAEAIMPLLFKDDTRGHCPYYCAWQRMKSERRSHDSRGHYASIGCGKEEVRGGRLNAGCLEVFGSAGVACLGASTQPSECFCTLQKHRVLQGHRKSMDLLQRP